MSNTFVWQDIESGLPDLRPVMLCKEPTDEILQINIGALVTNDSGVNGWFIGNETLVLTLPSRRYWTYVVETDLTIAPVKQDSELLATLVSYTEKLRRFEKKFQVLGAEMMKSGNGLYPLDLYINGILSRSSSLLYGFDTLINSENFLSAAHLVRPHLDNYLRLLAGWMVKDPHEFASQVLSGIAVRKMKDKNGKFMTDAYLKDKAVEDFPWMADVYEETSGFIHFSHKHILNATTLSSTKECTLESHIGKSDHQVSNQSKLEAIICMIDISNSIATRITGWIETKRFMG